MCTIVCDGHCRSVKSGTTGVAATARFVAAGLWLTARYVAWPAAVLTYRWASGAPLIANARPLTRPAWLVRVRWSQWPRWQRAAARLAVTLLAVGGWLAPLVTALTVGAAALTAAVAVAVARRRRRVAAARGGPLRVIAKAGQPIPVTGEPKGSRTWSEYQAAGSR